MNATRFPCSTATCWNSGNSARQGVHQEAHLFTTTGWPFNDASRFSNAPAPPERSWLAWLWSDASAGGDPASAFTATAFEGAALFDGPELLPAVASPTTTTTTSATPPTIHSTRARVIARSRIAYVAAGESAAFRGPTVL